VPRFKSHNTAAGSTTTATETIIRTGPRTTEITASAGPPYTWQHKLL